MHPVLMTSDYIITAIVTIIPRPPCPSAPSAAGTRLGEMACSEVCRDPDEMRLVDGSRVSDCHLTSTALHAYPALPHVSKEPAMTKCA